MLLWENIILAINGLLSNKMRAFLTMLGIIIGIGSVIAILTVGNSLTLSVSENMQSMGANDIYVMLESRTSEEEEGKVDGVKFGSFSQSGEISESDYITSEMIEEICQKFPDKIYAINLESQIGSSNIEVDKKSTTMNLLGVSAGYFVTNQLEMLAGSMFGIEDFEEGRSSILVPDDLVETLFDGDYQKALGREIEIPCNNWIGNFTIVGIYKNQNMSVMGSAGASNIYMPLKTANSFTHQSDKYTYFQVITKVGVNSDEFSGKLESFFESYYRNNSNFKITVMTLSSMVDMLTQTLSTITMAISVIAGIALLVGGIGVMNIMLVSITERTREIGTRKALGAKNSSIRIQFIVEAMIICLIGGCFGVMLGVGSGSALSDLLGYPASPSVMAIVVSLLFSMSIGVFFGYYPASKAAKMNPIDALRYE